MSNINSPATRYLGGVQSRTLGKQGPAAGAIGFGCLSLSQEDMKGRESESIALIHHAIDLGVTLLDTAPGYGGGHNEPLVGTAVRDRRDRVLVATKFGLVRNPDGVTRRVEGSPAWVRSSFDASLQRLGLDYVDVLLQHRVDPKVPIEDTVGAMAELVGAGKVRYLGLCEASVATLERASQVHPIAVLQSEWSLWSRELERDVLPAARRLGIGIMPYMPLGYGFLTGKVTSSADLPAGESRRDRDYFKPETLDRDRARMRDFERIAAEKGMTSAQLALAWLLAQGDDIVPIPGTKRTKYLDENVAAAGFRLSTEDLARIEAAIPAGAWARDALRTAAAPSRYGDSAPLPDH